MPDPVVDPNLVGKGRTKEEVQEEELMGRLTKSASKTIGKRVSYLSKLVLPIRDDEDWKKVIEKESEAREKLSEILHLIYGRTGHTLIHTERDHDTAILYVVL